MNIGIIFGGKSFEHEISIITAYQLKKKLLEYHNVYMIYVDINGNIYDCSKMNLNNFKNNKLRFNKLKLNKLHLDIIIGAMHGENGEDGYAYNFARINNIKYFGSKGFGSSIALDKYKTYTYLSNNGIKMIPSYIYTYNDYLKGKDIEEYPCIVKPLYGGSSIGIEVIKNNDEAICKLSNAFEFTDKILVQKYYDNIIEYNLALTEFDYSNLERINSKNEIFSFENKYNDSFKLIHQELINDDLYDRFKEIGRKVYELLDLNGIIRIDFFLINNEIYVNEVNTTPGALSMYLFDDFMEVFNKSLNNVLREKNVNYKVNYGILKNSNINK